MTMSQWRTYSIDVIAKALIEYQSNYSPNFVPSADDFGKWCSLDRYPFGERQYMPYKIWLKEIKRVKIFLSGWYRPDPKHPVSIDMAYRSWRDGYKTVPKSKINVGGNKKPMPPTPGQTSLF